MEGCFEVKKVGHGVEGGEGFGNAVEDVEGGLAEVDVWVGEFADVGFEVEGRGKG